MDHTGTVPNAGLTRDDLPELAKVFDAEGPFVTVYLTTEAEVENAAQLSEARWKDLRRQLADAGAPEEALAAIDPLVPDAHLEGETLAAIATAYGLLFATTEDEPPARDLGRVAPLPAVGPLIEWAELDIPHLVVLVDRTGADIISFGKGAEDVADVDVSTNDPRDPHLSKAKAGGWSSARYQRRAENRWEANAKDAAEAVTKAVESSGAQLIVLAGDVRSRELLCEQLGEPASGLVRQLDGSRGADGALDDLVDDVVRLVSTVASERTVAALQTFRQERGQADRAAAGVSDTVAALGRAQVATLLVHDDPDDERTAWFGPEVGMVATDPQALKDLGVDAPVEARLVDVLISQAWATGAEVCILPSASVVPEGVAAILRFAT